MTQTPKQLTPIDYLVIGHLTQDITPTGNKLGGTAAYSALTAKALGLRVGIVTAIGPEAVVDQLDGVQVYSIPAERSSTFENIATPKGRIQYLYHVAPRLDFSIVPPEWRETPIVHLGPIAQEVDEGLAAQFPNSFVGLTPQGWLRAWDGQNRVHPCPWPQATQTLVHATAAVLSVEDVLGEEQIIEEMAQACPLLVVTEGPAGSRLYWNGDMRRFTAPGLKEVDATGAGDIYSTAFFTRLKQTQDPWGAARFATYIASNSVTRAGINGVPTQDEINRYAVEII
jgi:hypothetical protein